MAAIDITLHDLTVHHYADDGRPGVTPVQEIDATAQGVQVIYSETLSRVYPLASIAYLDIDESTFGEE